VPVDPDEILTSININDMTLNGDDYYFEAVWRIRFHFYKGDMTVYNVTSTNLDFNPLEGAVFALDRPQQENGWQQIYTATSAANGRVIISSADVTTNALLELPRNITRYRLREITPPANHILPTGHWYIYIGPNGVQGMPFIYPVGSNNMAFHPVSFTASGNNYLRWHVGNAPEAPPSGEWDFFKVDYRLYQQGQTPNHIGGAHFVLFVYNGTEAPDYIHITPGMVGPAEEDYPWSVAAVIEGNTAETAMRFTLQPGRHYQLRETVAPLGFRTPFGQWRITVTGVDATNPAGTGLSITPIGDVPTIVPQPNGRFYIGNLPEIQLPLTGGTGSSPIVYAGMSIIVIALGFVVFFKFKPIKTR